MSLERANLFKKAQGLTRPAKAQGTTVLD